MSASTEILANIEEILSLISKGNTYSSIYRKLYSEKKKAAMKELEAGGHKATRTAVAAMTGISREHIGRRYGYLFKM